MEGKTFRDLHCGKFYMALKTFIVWTLKVLVGSNLLESFDREFGIRALTGLMKSSFDCWKKFLFNFSMSQPRVSNCDCRRPWPGKISSKALSTVNFQQYSIKNFNNVTTPRSFYHCESPGLLKSKRENKMLTQQKKIDF